ncbi:putative Dcp1-like decapping family protein [Blattamonas nauphoetae]|uniref:Dcp1-like decapping family protein n=1 Tax=Blattamonas nauphoetae TaxID=2049346 RepID=A0ABQ9XCB7_9EUKA|nr:putative Dcp1-like decapping family protein [Blattamonas nauphoetae]
MLSGELKQFQRTDTYITKIIYKISFVHLYTYDESKDTWTDMKCEGPMFIYERKHTPKYGFRILNQRQVENRSFYLFPETSIETPSNSYLSTRSLTKSRDSGFDEFNLPIPEKSACKLLQQTYKAFRKEIKRIHRHHP